MLHLLLVTLLQVAIFLPLNADRSLHLMHVTDVRYTFSPIDENFGYCRDNEKCFGGFARVAAFIKDRKRANSLSFSVGDMFYDSLAFSIFRQQPGVKFLKLMDFDALSLGHHDIEFGYEPFQKFVNRINIPIVGCNLLAPSQDHSTAGKILEFKNFRVGNLTVGVIGYYSPSVKLPGLSDELRITNLIPALRYCVKLSKGHGADVIIAIGQADLYEDAAIAKLVDVDIMIGSNAFGFFHNGPAPSTEPSQGPYPKVVKKANGKKVLILYSHYYTKYIGEITICWSDKLELLSYKGNSILLDNTFREDAKVTEFNRELLAKLKEFTTKKVGKTVVALNGRDCRTKECNFGNLVTDAMRLYIVDSNPSMRLTELFPITFFNSGSMKKVIETHKTGGVLTVGDLKYGMPLDSTLLHLRLDGKSILKIFEHSLKSYGFGGFLQISGARISGNLEKTRCRLEKAEVMDKFSNFEIIRKHRIYDVVTTGFIFAGGDNYFFFEKAEIVKKCIGVTVMSILQDFIKQNSPVRPEVEGRITIRFQLATISTGNQCTFSMFLLIFIFIWL